jgi:integrase
MEGTDKSYGGAQLPPDPAIYRLIAKKRAGKVTDGWIAACEDFLERAVAFFGVHRPLEQIRVSDVRAWAAQIRTLKGKTGRTLGPETARRHLFALSNLYRFAQEEELVPPGFNPVAALSEKPPRGQREAFWLEVPDAAVLLESARRLPTVETSGLEPIGADLAYPLVATFLLTGGRRAEVLGLELDDVSFDRKTVTFRPNQWRRLKNRRSHRVIPLWPQLETILRAWVFGRRLEMPGRLLFPSFATGDEARFVEIREGARPRGDPGRLAAGRVLHAGAPTYLLRGPAPDARPRRTGDAIHGVPRARPRLARYGGKGVRPPRNDAAPVGRRGVSSRAAHGTAAGAAPGAGVWHHERHHGSGRYRKRRAPRPGK